jgi:Type III secretion basal body protein I, YscI, HrpB, PscI
MINNQAINFPQDKLSGLEGLQQAQQFETGRLSSVRSAEDAQQFSQSLASYRERGISPVSNASPVAPASDMAHVSSSDGSNSIGARLMSGLSDLSSTMASKHKQVSALLEKATTSGDDKMMLKAMFAMSEYTQQAQMTVKVVAKASTSLDQLTRLQ